MKRGNPAIMLGLLCGMLAAAAGTAAEVAVPNFWDPRIRVARPEPLPPRTIRFLTEDDYAPFHFATPEGDLGGFSVELARLACERLKWSCTIQARRFDTLADALADRRGDVLAAALALTPQLRRRFAATRVYFRSPARFATAKADGRAEIEPATMSGKRVAVVAGSAHQAFLERFMPFVQARPAADLATALAALRSGEAEYLFGDGVALSQTLAAPRNADFALAGGPYLESAYFGEGIAFLTRKDDAAVADALDYALQSLRDDGSYARLYLRFFPVSPY